MSDISNSLDPRNQSPAEFIARAGRRSLPVRNARRWLALTLGKGEHSLAECGRLGILPRAFIETARELPRLRLEKRLVSRTSSFQKLVFRTADGPAVETVVIPLHPPGAYSLASPARSAAPWAAVTARPEECAPAGTWKPGR